MKTGLPCLLLCLLLFCLVTAGCLAPAKKKRFQKAIPGTYIRFSEHAFGREWDTLTIQKANREATVFPILRKWNYERILDGQTILPEYKRQSSVAVYDEDEHTLIDAETGEVYRFDDTNNTVATGATIYQKIK